MMVSRAPSLFGATVVGALLSTLLGCDATSEPAPGDALAVPAVPAAGGFEVPPPLPGSGSGVTALQWMVPEGWVAEPPGTSFRKAQYKVPGPDGDALFIVFYFGPQQGGGARANVVRWADQFAQADGRPGSQAMKSATRKAGDIEIETVEVTGTYSGGFLTKGPPRTGQMLLGAVAKGPDANWFFKFTGPKETLEAQRASYDALINGLKVGS